MEKERRINRPEPSGNDAGFDGISLEAVRSEMGGILEAVDNTLDSIGEFDSEQYLNQEQQEGGQ
jgi:hypothetical protein